MTNGVLEKVSVPLQQAEHSTLFDAPDYVPEQMGAIVIAETIGDVIDRDRAELLIENARRIGGVAVQSEVQVSTESIEQESAYPTLMHAIRAAASGDPTALKLVEMNVRTEALEIAFKSGHVSETKIAVKNGELTQWGQSMTDVFANSLRYASAAPEIFRRTTAEVRNGMRMKTAQQRGQLEDNYFVIFSRYTDELSDEQATEYGFFADTKSCSIQVITEVGKNELLQQSAFVAGVSQTGGERHDAQTVARVGDMLGVDLRGKSDVETIDMALLVPKNLMPNGVIDIVRMYDQAAGGTFFGEAKEARDYAQYLQECQRREASMESTVQIALGKLLAESRAIETPIQAITRLHKLVEGELVERSVTDKTINARVFGPEAAEHIQQARHYYDEGDTKRAEESTVQAKRTAKSNSCPSAVESADTEKSKSGDIDEDAEEASATSEVCIIETKNCYCCALNRDGTKRSSRLTVKAVIDSNETIHCLRDGCGAYLTKGGAKKEIGRIARRAIEIKAAERKKPKTTDEYELAA
ncbi:MAG: hypothetical protein ABWX94_01435 [Candidatus Saccharimonadales bacterium]